VVEDSYPTPARALWSKIEKRNNQFLICYIDRAPARARRKTLRERKKEREITYLHTRLYFIFIIRCKILPTFFRVG